MLTTYDVEVVGWLKGKQEPYVTHKAFVAENELQLLRLVRDCFNAQSHVVKWRLVSYKVAESLSADLGVSGRPSKNV